MYAEFIYDAKVSISGQSHVKMKKDV